MVKTEWNRLAAVNARKITTPKTAHRLTTRTLHDRLHY